MARLPGNTLNLTSQVLCISPFPDNERVAIASNNGVSIWNFRTNAQTHCLPGTDATAVAVSPNGTMIVSGNRDGGIQLWDANSGAQIAGPWGQHEERVWSVGWSPLEDRFASCSADGTVVIWGSPSGEVIRGPLQTRHGVVRALAYHPIEGKFATSGHNSIINIWDDSTASPPQEVRVPDNQIDTVLSLAWIKDGNGLILGCSDGVVRVWDIQSQTVVYRTEPDARDQAINYIAVSGHAFAAASAGSICVWDLKTRQRLCDKFQLPLNGNRPDEANCVALTADESTMIVCTERGNIYTFNIGDVISSRTLTSRVIYSVGRVFNYFVSMIASLRG